MTDNPTDQQDPTFDEHQDHFSHIIGRALIDPTYRDRLMGSSDRDQVAAMVEGGLTLEQANQVLPQLQAAVESITALHNHEVFGDSIAAA
jgi:hypothetical protein